MTEQQPIAMPSELAEQWRDEWVKQLHPKCTVYQYISTQAARWGYDQAIKELETFLEKGNDKR